MAKVDMAGKLNVEKLSEIKFVYNKPESYNLQFVNGVIGGPTSRGEIILNFFFEHADIPKEETNKVKEDGTAERDVPIPNVPEIQRDIKVGIIITPAVADNIKGFLERILKQIDESTKQAMEEAVMKEAEGKEVKTDEPQQASL